MALQLKTSQKKKKKTERGKGGEWEKNFKKSPYLVALSSKCLFLFLFHRGFCFVRCVGGNESIKAVFFLLIILCAYLHFSISFSLLPYLFISMMMTVFCAVVRFRWIELKYLFLEIIGTHNTNRFTGKRELKCLCEWYFSCCYCRYRVVVLVIVNCDRDSKTKMTKKKHTHQNNFNRKKRIFAGGVKLIRVCYKSFNLKVLFSFGNEFKKKVKKWNCWKLNWIECWFSTFFYWNELTLKSGTRRK